jgi:ribosomal-protein-alanine N-acetyltransferase
MVTTYLLWDPHPTLSFTKSYISLIEKKYKQGKFYDWGVEYCGRIIGTCGFTSFSVENNSAEIGYVIGSPYWGLGIATEVVKRVIEYGFSELSLNRMEAHFIIGNERSFAVMKKCHMTYEGTLRAAVFAKGRYADVGVASILRSEYESLRDMGAF